MQTCAGAARAFFSVAVIAMAALPGIAHAQKKAPTASPLNDPADAALATTGKKGGKPTSAPTEEALRDHKAVVSPLDPNFYVGRYPDLASRIGRNPEALQKHWDAYGRAEFRAPSRAGDPMVVPFSAWQSGCMEGKWGPFRRGKGANVRVPLCEMGHYQLAVAYHVMLEGPRSGNGRDYLRAGDYLKQGEYLVSANKRFFASLQPDGNFCTYDGASPASPHGGAKWCSMKSSAGAGPFFAIQQADGNFCVYRGTRPGDNKGGVWCTFNASKGGQPYYYAVLQDDANFAINRGSGPANQMGHVWDRVTATPPKPDTGWETFVKNVQAAQQDMAEFQRQQDAVRAQMAPAWTK